MTARGGIYGDFYGDGSEVHPPDERPLSSDKGRATADALEVLHRYRRGEIALAEDALAQLRRLMTH